MTFFPCLFWRPGSGIWNRRRKRVKKPQGKGNFNVKAMNAPYLAEFLSREDEKLEAAQVRRIIAALDEKCREFPVARNPRPKTRDTA